MNRENPGTMIIGVCREIPGYALKAKWARTTSKISKVGQDHFEIYYITEFRPVKCN